MTEAERIADGAGEAYRAWLKANGLRNSNVRFQAFIAGWALAHSVAHQLT